MTLIFLTTGNTNSFLHSTTGTGNLHDYNKGSLRTQKYIFGGANRLVM